MVYLSMLMALKDDRVFRQALEQGGPLLEVEFFTFRCDTAEMPLLREQARSFAGHPVTFHGPMRSAEMAARLPPAVGNSGSLPASLRSGTNDRCIPHGGAYP